MTCFGSSLQILEEASSGGVLCLHLFGASRWSRSPDSLKIASLHNNFYKLGRIVFLTLLWDAAG